MEPGPIDQRPLAGLQVLAIDDNPDALEVLHVSLAAGGATMVTARSGAAALALLTTAAPDVILCDLAMPEMDGFEFIRRLRALPHGSSIPVLAVSAHVTAEHRSRSREAGFYEHIAKPYQREALIRAIERAIRAGGGTQPRLMCDCGGWDQHRDRRNKVLTAPVRRAVSGTPPCCRSRSRSRCWCRPCDRADDD